MSFGFSPSDVVTLIKIVTKAYKGWENACGNYANITSELDGLLIILNRLNDEAQKPESVLVRNPTDLNNLRDVLRDCRGIVVELDDVVERYRNLGLLKKSREKTWKRICFGVRNFDDLRTRLNRAITRISGYLDVVGLGVLGRIERDVNAIPQRMQDIVDGLAAEIRAGRREGTVMTDYGEDEPEVWKQFRRELIGEGMRSGIIHKYKPQIRAYLRQLAEQGLLEEAELAEEDNDSGSGNTSLSEEDSSVDALSEPELREDISTSRMAVVTVQSSQPPIARDKTPSVQGEGLEDSDRENEEGAPLDDQHQNKLQTSPWAKAHGDCLPQGGTALDQEDESRRRLMQPELVLRSRAFHAQQDLEDWEMSGLETQNAVEPSGSATPAATDIINLNVCTLTGKIVTISTSRRSTMLSVARALEDKDGIPPFDSRLIYKGKRVYDATWDPQDDERTVEERGLEDGARLDLVLSFGRRRGLQ